jgi:hypothetical protein
LRLTAIILQSNAGTDASHSMMWHVVFAEPGQLPRSRAARSRDAAILSACELMAQGYDVRRILEPHDRSIERAELEEHFDAGRLPGLRIPTRPSAICSSATTADLFAVMPS